ncbi:MAG: STAS domain-containing protein [Gemmatimonadota bacterium]|nr:STAS domain-containing protein [Gemmatimonadota bacterium]
MQVKVRNEKNLAVISVNGDVDLYSSPEMRNAITDLSKKKVPLVVVNLAEVDYMDSSGVATLVEGLRLVSSYKGEFRIACLKPSVREVFELARLDKVFSIFDSEEEAVKTD